ncbi:hypothetical protein [Prauserella cavernicola]|uniref:Uncharacterized protein n=1 Tax=Prauserella cavernicola TaxID=2800127 RepID=A0A934V4S3_9PSEU|nr:hypothetical protein [Prauserella cavernicola]MBK1785019.1 hypothetical protein [Prauserella cavernicola]
MAVRLDVEPRGTERAGDASDEDGAHPEQSARRLDLGFVKVWRPRPLRLLEPNLSVSYCRV